MIDSLIGAVLGAILGAIFTLWIVENTKNKAKRKVNINLLSLELNKFSDPSIKGLQTAVNTPHRPAIIWIILQSEALHPRKDFNLIKELHELVSWMEKYNELAALSNDALIAQSPSYDFLNNASYKINVKLYEQSRKVKSLLDKSHYNKKTTSGG